jgi:UDP-glucose 4-epimerase
VVHLAAAVGVRKIIEEPVSTITTNVRGTEIVLDCCDRHGKPLFVASTSEIYGKGGDQLHEEADRVMGSTTHRRWAYACTKALDEFLALAYNRERGLPVILGRFFNTVGPRQTGQWGMVLPNFVGRALRGEPIQVFGDGRQQRCFCMVHDTVRAILGLMAYENAWGRAFNIGSEEETTIQALAERVRARLGSDSAIERVPYAEAYGEGFEDMERRKPDTGRIRASIDWQPEYTLDEIIDATAEHMRNAAAA